MSNGGGWPQLHQRSTPVGMCNWVKMPGQNCSGSHLASASSTVPARSFRSAPLRRALRQPAMATAA